MFHENARRERRSRGSIGVLCLEIASVGSRLRALLSHVLSALMHALGAREHLGDGFWMSACAKLDSVGS